MGLQDYQKMDVEALKKELLALCKEHFSLIIQKTTSQDFKPHLIRRARRNIARVKTLLTQKKSMLKKGACQ